MQFVVALPLSSSSSTPLPPPSSCCLYINISINTTRQSTQFFTKIRLNAFCCVSFLLIQILFFLLPSFQCFACFVQQRQLLDAFAALFVTDDTRKHFPFSPLYTLTFSLSFLLSLSLFIFFPPLFPSHLRLHLSRPSFLTMPIHNLSSDQPFPSLLLFSLAFRSLSLSLFASV